jgi:hypothetical protein
MYDADRRSHKYLIHTMKYKNRCLCFTPSLVISVIFSIPCNESFSTFCFDLDAIKLKFLNSVSNFTSRKGFCNGVYALARNFISYNQRTLSRTQYLFIEAATCSAPSESSLLELRSKYSNREPLLFSALQTSRTPSFFNVQLPRSR